MSEAATVNHFLETNMKLYEFMFLGHEFAFV